MYYIQINPIKMYSKDAKISLLHAFEMLDVVCDPPTDLDRTTPIFLIGLGV